MADLSIKLSSTRTLSVVRNDDAIVAKITDNVTGREMTLGWGALTKLMASVPFVTRARESLLVDCANERFGKIPRLPLKRKLDFDSVVNDSPVRGSPISGLDLYRGTEMIPAPPKKRRIMAEASENVSEASENVSESSENVAEVIDNVAEVIDLTQDDDMEY